MSWGKAIKCEACRAFNCLLAANLINSIIQEHKIDSLYQMTQKFL